MTVTCSLSCLQAGGVCVMLSSEEAFRLYIATKSRWGTFAKPIPIIIWERPQKKVAKAGRGAGGGAGPVNKPLGASGASRAGLTKGMGNSWLANQDSDHEVLDAYYDQPSSP